MRGIMKKSLGLSTIAALSLVLGTLVASPAQAVTPTCTITVADSDITVNGTSSGDVICLNGDNLIVNALGGNDTVIDNGNNNTINLGDGNDTLDGSNGNGETVDGGLGNDTLTGTPGDDEFTGGDGEDTIVGGEANDVLSGGAGVDNLSGNAGNDTISGDAGNDSLDGGDGVDTENGGVGDDSIVGGYGNDVLSGGDGTDNLAGSAGDDVIAGDSGNDSLDGGDGADTATGGIGDDTLIGGASNDILSGGDGADRLEGSLGNDEVYGESGPDYIFGGLGDDVLAGGPDVDQVDGGPGLNMCDYTSGEPLTTTCTYDDVGPALVSATTSTSSVDVSTTSKAVTVTLNITDSTGISNGFFQCRAGSRNAILIYFSYRTQSAWNVNSPVTGVTWTGTSKNATMTATQSVDFGLYPGTYSCSVSLTDVLLQTSITSASSLSVIRTGSGFDDLGPALESVAFSSNPVEVGSSSATSRVSLHFSDQTGLRNGWFQCYVQTPGSEKTTDAILAYFTWQGKQLSNGTGTLTQVSWTGTQTDSTLTFDVSVPLGFRPGDYPCSITMFDTKDQQTQGTSVATFQVTRTGTSFDDSAPTIASFEVSPNPVDVGSSAVDTDVTLHLTDMTGIKNGYIDCAFSTWGSPSYRKAFLVYYTWSSRSIYSESGNDRLVSFTGTDTDATLKVKGHVPMGLLPGAFTCSVNAVDTLNHSITDRTYILNVQRTPPGMPTAPSGLVFTPTSGRPTEGTLTWTAPTSLGDPTLYTYEVQYSTNGITWNGVSHGASIASSISLTNLQAGSTYSFRVRGENGGNTIVGSAGAAWSETLTTQTPPAISALAPASTTVSAITSSSASISWSAPDYNGGASITNFLVQLSIDGGSSWSTVPHAVSTALSVSLTGLLPGSSYLVRVAPTNAVGSENFTSASFTTVRRNPDSPQNLSVVNISSTSLSLQWQLPVSNGGSSILDYKVEVSGDSGTTWTVIQHSASNNLGFDVSNLLKNHAYKFRVSAVNIIGVGNPSEVVSVTTLPTVPDAPTTLSVSGISANGATVKWLAPIDRGGQTISDYKIEISRNSGETWQVVPHEASSNLSIALSGLTPGQTYDARVSALNATGYSEPESVSFSTLTTPPTAPQSLQSNNVTSTSITLNWELPASNGGTDITDYKIEFSSNGGTTWNLISHNQSAVRSFNVTGLTRGISYKFRVTAITGVAGGIPSGILTVSTLFGVPSQPLGFSATAVTAKTATLKWTKPTDLGGTSLAGYEISISADGGQTWIQIPHTTPITSGSYNVTGLTPGVTYGVKINASNSVGSSPALTGTFTTLKTVATAPLNLQSTEVTDTTTVLAWELPVSNGGSSLTDYKIEVSSNCSTFTAVSHAASNSLGFGVRSLKPGTKYCFRVSGKNAQGFGATSTVLQIVTVGNAPNAPTGLGVTAAKTSVTLKWKAATVSSGSSVRNYLVEYSTDSGATWITFRKSVSTSTSLSVTGLRTKTRYMFRVTAVNDVGNSPTSAVLNVKTK